MDSFVAHYLGILPQPIAYLIVFFGMFFEGDALLFITGFLTHQGYFEFLPILATVLSGVFIGDNLWYRLGFWIKNSDNALKKWVERITQPFDAHIINNPLRTIFLSKFTYGFNHAILIRAGSLGIKWKKLEESDLLASFCWVLAVGGLGYASSASFSLFKHYIRFGEIALATGFGIFLLIEYIVTKKTKKKL